MIDPDMWERLAFHLLDEVSTYQGDEIAAERAAVLIFSAIHARLTDPENE